MNSLDQLKTMTDVVADTGDIEAIAKYKPLDATTNPSLLLKAALIPRYKGLLLEAKKWAEAEGGSSTEQLQACADKFAVSIGHEILSIIPGKISTEVDSRLSFETQATVTKANRLIELYADMGVSSDRVLIKIASTFEGIRAAEILQKQGINCNLTLLFGFAQAAASADAGAYLISPFVGRILDWYKASAPGADYSGDEDPGVVSVKNIYQYYKQHHYDTVVMGASFRNTGEIKALAGCDRLTISPQLLEELSNDDDPLDRKLSPENVTEEIAKANSEESVFRWAMNEDAMATEKLAEGIRNFTVDQIKLESILVAS